ncbi:MULTISPECIES: putative holin [Halomonas]|uniref:putative holin n=1 Tax=Halomonas TaxID=2745 RepID=UPI001C97527E|nr:MULTISPECIES: putative holin [Halomonas]MBY6206881.1 phage holin family protein [Halomonas sp. DP3Y7-2]MBY6230355.1 phage holin family protein [Halomonas sp. DP3Y7-1]MCA0918516.1 phage holin family protein [Halomonas denitrificans]
MAEPNTATAAATASLTAALIGVLPGIDANAVVGAFCGATLFVISAKDLGILVRIAYLMISFCIGYLGGPAMLGNMLEHSAVAAFIMSAVTVTAGLRAIEGVKTLDIKAWLGGRK